MLEGGNQLPACSGARWWQNWVVFPAWAGQGCPGGGFDEQSVNWQEFQPPVLAVLAHRAFAVPSLWRVAMGLTAFTLPRDSWAVGVCFTGSSIPAGWACGDGPSCWSPVHCHF